MMTKHDVDFLMALLPTPAEADAMGIYYDVVAGDDVFSYKGEYLGTVQEISNKKWHREMMDKVYSGEISEEEFEQMCEERS